MNDSVNRQFSRRSFLGTGSAAAAAFAVAGAGGGALVAAPAAAAAVDPTQVINLSLIHI